MSRPKHASRQVRAVLLAFAEAPGDWHYGYDLSRRAGVGSGTLYPALARLADDGLLEHTWQLPGDDGGRPRHCYRLTADGVAFVDALIERSTRPSGRLAFRTP